MSEDDFEYWLKLTNELGEKLKEITNWIQSQVIVFVGQLKFIGIKYVEYHIFPFDTRSIPIVLGPIVLGYRNEAYLTLSLEDIDIKNDSLTIGKLGISSWIGTHDRSVMKEFNYEEIPLNVSISIGANSLLNLLIAKYDELIAKRYNLPGIPIPRS